MLYLAAPYHARLTAIVSLILDSRRVMTGRGLLLNW
jgi:hypothetical protein